MSLLAALNASTIWASTSESGGVWLVQNLTTVAEAAQAAPVIGVGSALAPAACDALAPALAAAEAEATGATEAGAATEGAVLAVLELQAARTTTIVAARTAQRDRPRPGLMAPPLGSNP